MSKEPMDSSEKEKFLEMMMPGNHTYQLIFGIAFFILWILDSFLLRFSTLYSDVVPFWIPLIPSAFVFLIALYLIDASHKDLFNSGPFGLRTEGIFSKVRHPMYLGTALVYLALAIATISVISLILFFFIFLGYNHIANFEERKLEQNFGEEYIDYKQRVGKWIPKL